MTAPPRLRVDLTDVALARDGRPVFEGLSLTLTERRVGVIGRNGAGKSQLSRLIAGLVRPDRGEVRVDGIDVARDRRAAIRSVGILFQNPDHQIIFPTVDEELAFGLTSLGLTRAEARARVTATLARFGRQDWAGRNVQTLSQGQRHLLCLMAVLAMEPATILLDEPFAGLDLATELMLNAILSALPQRLIHVTHDLGALAGYDRVVWLDAGRIVGDGAPAAVIAAYRAEMAERARHAGTEF
ncbi:energy-coupling factor ABC transporter ATP-binding protein [Ruixingdingia sedimenti]|uniref:ABC transporter ATP-binding protein n=1 Tax=Ruixingdingia sedimenti TaxID=3073604 RepID=A0ABU1F5M4_9RHOB|nr:ABC transporter ATP-binding protein [Xinfangfangia sp. LG-4]MDR5652174.1 ABC transporter ATP-binding protein [Xinfangfangia sp. LG-4]